MDYLNIFINDVPANTVIEAILFEARHGCGKTWITHEEDGTRWFRATDSQGVVEVSLRINPQDSEHMCSIAEEYGPVFANIVSEEGFSLGHGGYELLEQWCQAAQENPQAL